MASIKEQILKAYDYDKRFYWLEAADYRDDSYLVKINMFRRCMLLLCMFFEKKEYPGLKVEKKEDFFAFESIVKKGRFHERAFYIADDTYTNIFKNFLTYYGWEIDMDYSWSLYFDKYTVSKSAKKMYSDSLGDYVDKLYIAENKKLFLDKDEDPEQYDVADIVFNEYSDHGYLYSFHNQLADKVHELYKKLPYSEDMQYQYNKICNFLNKFLKIFEEIPSYENFKEVKKGYYIYSFGGIYYQYDNGSICDYDLFLMFRIEMLYIIPQVNTLMKDFIARWESSVNDYTHNNRKITK